MEEKPITAEENPPTTWPAVPLAYEFVTPAFGWINTRLAAVESRLQLLISFSAALMLAAPVLATAVLSQPNFRSVWFLSGVAVFFAIAIVGIVTFNWGTLLIISPQLLYDKYLHCSDWEFKKDILYFAGEGFQSNLGLINSKGNVTTILTVAFVVETLLFVMWIATP